jgi:hypothetical protein
MVMLSAVVQKMARSEVRMDRSEVRNQRSGRDSERCACVCAVCESVCLYKSLGIAQAAVLHQIQVFK